MLDERHVSNTGSPEFKKKLGSLYAYLVRQLGIQRTPLVKLVHNKANSDNMLGKTGYYDAENKCIVLYITDRHPKDVLRSFAHECIHFWQHEHGNIYCGSYDPQYAQNNPHLRRMEMQAYLLGNIFFRDWSDVYLYGNKRMELPQTLPILPRPLDENLTIGDGRSLDGEVDRFIRTLISRGILGSYHRDATSGDMNANDFAEDLKHQLLSSIQKWIETVNNRGNRENGPGMIK